MSTRRITHVAGSVEVKPGKRRRATHVAGSVEVKPGKYRRVTHVALSVESELGACVHGGPCTCPLCHEANDATKQDSNPISIRLGEKREEITDLVIHTPTGPLAFTRSYRQSKQSDANYQFMGLGWTHNHQMLLEPPVSGKVVVRGTNGSELQFFQSVTNTYPAAPGSTSVVIYNTGTSRYTLTASDKSTYVFDSTGKLLSRSWPNNETWTYSYASGKLAEVDDGYGRKLVFRYVSGGDHDGQLWRVGDHTFDDTDPNNPTGRYVEYGYDLNKILDANSQVIDGTDSLLVSASDVRDPDLLWTYEYYAEDGPDADVRQLNYLIARHSPPLNGMGSEIAIEENTYTLQDDELAVNGDMETNSDWTAVGSPTHGQSSAQVDEGSFSWHVDAASGQGIQGNTWNLQANRTYIVIARVYPVSGTAKLQVSGETAFNRSSSGTGAWETLRALYVPSADASNRRVQFVADGGAAEFYVDSVSVIESDLSVEGITQERGDAALTTDYSFQPANDLTTEVTAGLETRHHFRNGVYLGTEDPAGHLPRREVNWEYRPKAQVDANGHATWLDWSADGKNLLGVSDALNHATSFSYNSDDTLKDTTDAQARKTAYFYDTNLRQPSLILVGDTITEITAINGSMEADSGWSNVGSPSVNARSSTQVDSGAFARRVVANSGAGIQSATWTLAANKTHVLVARVFPVNSGNVVKMKVSGTTAFDVLSDGHGAWQTLRAVATPTSGGTVRLQFLVDSASGEFYVDSVHVVQVTNLYRWQDFHYDLQRRAIEEALVNIQTGAFTQRTSRSYGASGNGEGLLESLTQHSADGPADDSSMVYTYDSAGRVIKTQKTSLFGSCEFSYTVYDPAGNVLATVCGLEDTTPPADVTAALAMYDAGDPIQQHNRVTIHEYDALGRRVKTTVHAGASFAQTSVTVYDALDRVVRTITNFVDASYNPPAEWVFEGGVWKDEPSGTTIAHGADNTENIIADTAYNARGLVRWQRDVLGNVTLLGYDDAGRLVKTVQSASDPAYNNDYIGLSPDPDLSAYTPVSDPDQDIITEQVYDAAGNLVQSIDALGYSHFTMYDALNRPVKTVRSAKDEASIALDPGEVGYDAADDPRSASYVASADPDRDLIQTSTYDAMGRVVKTQRLLENRGGGEQWETTLFGYDPLGRQVKVIRSASNANYNLAADPDLSAYSPSSDPDEDLITQTVYDDHGRTLYTQDVLDVHTWFGYDGLGRQVKTIASAVGTATDGGVNDPRSASYSPSSEADEDLITRTVYNSDGRVQETEDVLGNVTYFVYDSLGRQIRTIQNYVPQGATDPADWEWDAGDDRWEDGAGNAISHGTDNDENRLSETVYDAQGRVEKTFDHRHNEARFSYDALGRRVQTIQNYGDGTFSSGTPDEDIVSTAEYDVAGRVIATTDNAGIETRFAYDLLGRRVKTIQNYVNGVFNPAAPDEDLISETAFNKAGQAVSATDARGTETAFSYDAAGRRLTVTQAAGTALETVSYTGYDKAGRVRRVIQNWIDNMTSPDAQDGSGDWLFAPVSHGADNDENLITEYVYDQVGRRVQAIDPMGNATETAYHKDGQSVLVTDAEDVDTAYRYDQVRRRNLVVQNFVANGEDPSEWVWDGVTDDRWEQSSGTAIAHGADNDQNVIVQVGYDKAGRMTSLRDPRGNETSYAYDALGRRLSLTNPLSIVWETAYSDLASGGTRTTQTLPGVNGGSAYSVQRDFDRLGRLSSLQYGDPANTPDVAFGYDAAGNRTRMTEYGGSGFTSPVRETLYGYDDVRRLTSVGFDTDANSSVDEIVSYEYDAGGLRTKLTLPGSLEVVYTYDAKGQLTGISDWDSQAAVLGYDAVGRHIATERHNDFDTAYAYDPAGRLTALTHEDLSGSPVTLAEFAYTLDGRGNRTQAVEQVRKPDTSYDNHTIQYTYDNLSRLIEADYDSGSNVYTYGYDLAGNLVDMDGAARTYNAVNQMTHDGTNSLTYDDNGNLTSDGVNDYMWDRANRLLEVDTGTPAALTAYSYDGVGNRISQAIGTSSPVVTQYLLDTQPGLTQVLAQTAGAVTDRFIHSPRGIHAHQNDNGDWFYPAQDGLGSVRGVADDISAVQGMQHYAPYGTPFGAQGSLGMPFGFTGEQTDGNEMIFLRARYLSPNLGTFLSLDPFEGMASRPMSLNGYMYVEGRVVNTVDPSGECGQPTNWWDPVDANCYYSAIGLAQRFSQGNPQAYNEWFNVLIKRSWLELKAIEAGGTINDATILPSLALYAEPGLVLQALNEFTQQLICGLSANIGFATIITAPGVFGGGAAAGIGLKGLLPGALIGSGIGIGLSLLLGLNAFVRTATDEEEGDKCTREEMEKRIGAATVASQIVGTPDLYPNQDTVDRPHVVSIAVSMCKRGYDQNYPIQYIQFADRKVILQGHHRFVASYVARVAPILRMDEDVSSIESDPRRRFEWSQVRIR